MNLTERLKLVAFLLFLTAIIIFFGQRKLDFHMDEIANYGLSNHVVGKDAHIDYGKVYTGLGPFEDFVEVDATQRFNYKNVYHNQWEDVHPPLYYCIFHTVCSFFPNSFSVWYGIGLNIFWMWCIVFVLYRLLMLMTQNTYLSMGILLAFCTTPLFINLILFIRMYAQLTFVALALAYLIKIYWDKQLDKKFYFFFSVLLLSGMLTQYYYMFFAFSLCFLFALHLHFEKRTKEIVTSLIVSGVDALIYLVVWRHAIKHVFWGYRGEEAMASAFSLSTIKNVLLMIVSLNIYLFCGLYFIISIVLIVVFVKKLRAKSIVFSYEYALVYSAIFYLIAVGKVAPYQHFRYYSPVAFVFVYAGIVITSNLLKERLGLKKAVAILVGVCLVANFAGIAATKFYVEMDFYSEAKAQLFEELEGKTCVIYIDEDWVVPSFFEPVQHAKSYVFLNSDTLNLVDEYNKPGYVWAIYGEHADKLPKEIKGKCIYSGSEYYYLIEANN